MWGNKSDLINKGWLMDCESLTNIFCVMIYLYSMHNDQNSLGDDFRFQ